MRNKHYDIDTGQAGSGYVDLANGNLVFGTQINKSDSHILPIDLLFIYNSNRATTASAYGRGFRLSLQQTLVQIAPNNGTLWRYTDASGDSIDITVRWYHIDNNGNKVITTNPSLINISPDGRLTRTVSGVVFDVVEEGVNREGLTINVVANANFIGRSAYESRHEEIVETQDRIRQISRAIADAQQNLRENGNFANPISLLGTSFNSIEAFQNRIAADIRNIEAQNVADFNALVAPRNTLRSRQQTTANITRKSWWSVPRVNSTNIHSGMNINWAASFTVGNGSRFVPNDLDGRMVERISQEQSFEDGSGNPRNRARARAFYDSRYRDRVADHQQWTADQAATVETTTWTQQQNANTRQANLNTLQHRMQTEQSNLQSGRREMHLAIWQEDLNLAQIALTQQEHMLNSLRRKIPINYIVDDGIQYGYNEFGDLCYIGDGYDNQVLIVFDTANGNRISSIVEADGKEISLTYRNGRLHEIKDFEDRTTRLSYDNNGNLIQIRNPDGGANTYQYTTVAQGSATAHCLSRIISPSHMGVSLGYLSISNNIPRVINVSNITHMSSASGGKVNAVSQAITISTTTMTYDVAGRTTAVNNDKTPDTALYFFESLNNRLELLHSIIRGQLVHELITTFEGRRNSNGTLYTVDVVEDVIGASDSNLANNLLAIRNAHVQRISTLVTATDANIENSVRNLFANANDKIAWEVNLHNDIFGQTVSYRRSSRIQNTNNTNMVDWSSTQYGYNDKRQLTNTIELTQHNTMSQTHTTNYKYNKQGKIIRKVCSNGVVQEIQFDKYGNVVLESDYHNADPSSRLISKSQTDDSGKLIAEYDESGKHKTTYQYFGDTSRVTSITQPSGGAVAYGRDFATHKLLSLSSSANDKRNTTQYTYAGEFLTGIKSSGVDIQYNYDSQGRKNEIFYNNSTVPYVTYTYEDKVYKNLGEFSIYCDVTTATYNNGERYTSFVDIHDRLHAVYYNRQEQEPLLLIRNWYEDSVNMTNITNTQSIQEIQDNIDALTRSLARASIFNRPIIQMQLTMQKALLISLQNTTNQNNQNTPNIQNTQGRLLISQDRITRQTTEYAYDRAGNVMRQTVQGTFADSGDSYIIGQNISRQSSVDLQGRLGNVEYSVDGRMQIYKYNYSNGTGNKIAQLESIELSNKDRQVYTVDGLGRITDIDIVDNNGSDILATNYQYVHHKENATTDVASITHRVGNKSNAINYVYDEDGRIVEVRSVGKLQEGYKYDGIGRLVREDNRLHDKTVLTQYDNNGNILSKTTHKLDFDEDTTKLVDGKAVVYSYDKRERLVGISGEDKEYGFEYDSLGNPTTYKGMACTWTHLRNLKSINTTDYGLVEFEYNASNLRTYKDFSKDINGDDVRFESYYHYIDDKLLSETRTATTNNWISSTDPVGEFTQDLLINTQTSAIDYIYCAEESAIGFTLTRNLDTDKQYSKTYYYVKNLQGDVTSIITKSYNGKDGSVAVQTVAQYVYDAWGNHTVTLDIDGIGSINPIRYRSYYFDVETSLYYLKSRYYDPSIGRFISIDGIGIVDETSKTINGLNLYAYCLGNPVMMTDDDGCLPRWLRTVLVVAAVVAVVAVAVTVTALTGGLAAPLLIGAAVGFGVGGVSSVVTQLATTGSVNWWSAFKAGAFGAVSGALMASGIGKIGLVAGLAATGFASSVASDWASGESINWGAAALSGAISGVFGIKGGAGAQHGKQLLARKKVLASKKIVANKTKQGLYSNRGAAGAKSLTNWRLGKANSALRASAYAGIRGGLLSGIRDSFVEEILNSRIRRRIFS